MKSPDRPPARVWIAYAAQALFLAVVTAVLYAPALRGRYVLDDIPGIYGNPLVRDPSLPLLGADGVLGVIALRPRGFGYLTFRLGHVLHGLEPAGHRVFNDVVHALCGVLVLVLVNLLLRTPSFRDAVLAARRRWIAFAAATLFVVHPVNTQAVSYVVQRLASLATLFFLLALVLYLLARREGMSRVRGGILLGASVLVAALGVKTKETVVTLPAVVVIVEWMFLGGGWLRAIPRALPFLAVGMLAPLSFAYERHVLGMAEPSTGVLTHGEYVLTQLRVVATYLGLLAWPSGLRLEYDIAPSRALSEPAVLAGLALHVALAALGVLLWRRAGEPLARLVALGIAWFYVTLSVESGLVPIPDLAWEHRLYLPSVGAFIAVTAAFTWMVRSLPAPAARGAAIAAAVVVLAAFAVVARQRNVVWGSGIALLEDTVRKAPGKGRAHQSLGDAYEDRDMIFEAQAAYTRALELDPGLDGARFRLGRCYIQLARWPEAEALFRDIVRVQPGNGEAHGEWGTALWMTGQPEAALREYRVAQRWDPTDARLRSKTGALLLDLGRPREALAELEEARRLRPGDPAIQGQWERVRAVVEGQ